MRRHDDASLFATWLKTKCFIVSTFVVVGTDRDRKTEALRALLARDGSAGLNYAGAAFIALKGKERREFRAEVEHLTTSRHATVRALEGR